MTLNQITQKISGAFKSLSSRSSVAAIAFLVLVGGFLAYRNFSSQTVTSPEELKIESGNLSLNDEGTIAGGATSPEVSQKTFGQGAVAGEKTVLKAASSEKWVARFMEKDSLKGSNSYKVQKGDTLWEIAKAKYGRGFEWQKILEANKDKVGFLPNGSQARIEIGQELTLP